MNEKGILFLFIFLSNLYREIDSLRATIPFIHTRMHFSHSLSSSKNEADGSVVLVDMDGCLVDWDRGFLEAWDGRSPVNRSISYHMENCVPLEYRDEARRVFHGEGFFRDLPEMEGGITALNEMVETGYRVFICTSPLNRSRYCAQEKIEWVREHLGEVWLQRIIMASDKTKIRGDVLIDDKPMSSNKISAGASWKQLVFDAPYNSKENAARLTKWRDWRVALEHLRGASPGDSEINNVTTMSYIDTVYMKLALRQAQQSFNEGEVPIGSVLIDQLGRVIASSRNQVESQSDSTAHAEMNCIRLSSKLKGNWRLLDCTIYSTLEPCPMCMGAIYASRIRRVVYGAADERLGSAGSWLDFDASRHPFHSLEVEGGVLHEESSALLTRFFRNRRAKKQSDTS